jgi:hypothetical protein
MGRLVINSHPSENDLVGNLIVPFMSVSMLDINDLMTLTHHDSHRNAQKILRTIFERVVTLKYIAENPNEAKRFMDYDAIDTQQVLNGIKEITGLSLNEPARTNLSKAAEEAKRAYKQEKCQTCGKPKYLGWSSLNSKDMADRVNLGHMHLHAFLMPSKLIHPSYWGLRETVSKSSPMYNTMNCVHELMVQLVLIHRRHFVRPTRVTPLMDAVVRDFLRVWVYSQTSFGGLLTEYAPKAKP